MLSQNERKRIIALINREVVPAIGCTEPIAVALCTARAAELLGSRPEKVAVRLSANILKNAMGVGIPGTGMIGLPIAVALGALVGRSEYQLEVLRDVTPEAVERGRRMIDGRRIAICLKEDADEKLYIEAEAEAAGHRAVAVIAGGHTSFVFVSRDGEVLLDEREDVFCLWRTRYRKNVKMLDYEVDLFRLQPDGAWERDFEEHHQRAYTVEELTAWLEEAGFTAIRTHGELKLRRANERDGRIYFSCIRK